MMKKPDRFERVAQKCIDKHFEDCPIGCRLYSSIVAQLLRQEHVAMQSEQSMCLLCHGSVAEKFPRYLYP